MAQQSPDIDEIELALAELIGAAVAEAGRLAAGSAEIEATFPRAAGILRTKAERWRALADRAAAAWADERGGAPPQERHGAGRTHIAVGGEDGVTVVAPCRVCGRFEAPAWVAEDLCRACAPAADHVVARGIDYRPNEAWQTACCACGWTACRMQRFEESFGARLEADIRAHWRDVVAEAGR